MIAVANEGLSLEFAIGGYVLIVVSLCAWLMRRRVDKLAGEQRRAQAANDRLQRSVKDEMIPALRQMVDRLERVGTAVHDHLVDTHGEVDDEPIDPIDLKALCEDLAALASELSHPPPLADEGKAKARTDDRRAV